MVYTPSKALAEHLSMFVQSLSEADVDKALALMHIFIDAEQLEAWVKSEGKRMALTRALNEIGRDKLAAEGTKIDLMQYIVYKHRSLESGIPSLAEFHEIERELYASTKSPKSHDFLCEVWSAAFVDRMRNQLFGKGRTDD